MPFIMSHSRKYFTAQNFINCAFYSALASILPFLNIHLTELGLSWAHCAWINCMSALVSMLGPLCLGPLAHKLSGYKQTLVLVLILAFLSVTSLLFVPNVVLTEHTPKMYFDCNKSVLRVEQCPNWDGQCNAYPQRPATNFSSFEFVTCSYFCLNEKIQSNSSWYPINVCFFNNDEPANLCLDVPREKIIPIDTSLSQDVSIQFDSRFDRWPIIQTDADPIVDRLFDGLPTCSFKPTAPLLMLQQVYSSIQCSPIVPSCNIYCSINLRHRTIGVSGPGSARVRPPKPCQSIKGNPRQTFYLYLLFRCLTDLTLLTSHTLIEAIRVANTNNYDSFYGGFERFWTTILPFIVWPPLCGILCDYFATMEVHAYAPPIIIFDGFVAITIFLIIMLPLSSTQTREHTRTKLKQQPQQQQQHKKKMVLKPTKFRYPRTHSDQYLWYRLALLIPMVLILGAFWGLADTLIRPFYRQSLHASIFLVGFSHSCAFLVTAVFASMAKSVIAGVGRMHLILLAFIFYALRNAGTSFLVAKYSRKSWLLLPFELMSSFCLPLAWIGITAYGQHLIKRSPNPLSYVTGTTIFQTYSPHVIMQYTLSLIHFGGGRALGSAFANIWLNMWPDIYNYWLWLTDLQPNTIDRYAIETILNQDTALRILLRLTSIISLGFGIIFLFLYHSCCLNYLIPRHDSTPVLDMLNSKNPNYLKLKSKSENEVYPLKSHQKHRHNNGSGTAGTKPGDVAIKSVSITRSLVTLRESSVDDGDDDDDDFI